MHAINKNHTQWLYYLAAFFSLLLSYLATFRAPVINPDGICYVQSAVAMKMGLSTAMQLCGQAKWPFYSALIYGMANLTNLSYINAAYLLDSLFSLISVLSFISIIRFINDSPRVLGFAAFVILLSHEFNAVREYIIRDHGFWAFYLVSVLFLLHYFQKRQFMFALGWSGSILLATLFRIEGIVFLILLPWIAFFMGQSFKSNLQSFFKLNALTAGIILIFGLWAILHSSTDHQYGRLGEVRYQLIHGMSEIVQRFNANANVIGDQVLNHYASHDAKQVLILLLMGWFLLSVVTNISFIYAFLVVVAWVKKCFVTTRQNHLVVWSYVVINVVITFFFLIENMFLSKRYLLALSLTLMIWTPFALDYFCQAWPRRRQLVTILSILIVFFSLGGIFDFGYSKRYIRSAGQWLEQNVPSDAMLYSNDEQLMYYSQHFGNALFVKGKEFSKINIIAGDAWKHYDYLALRMNKKDLTETQAELALLGNPIQEFANKRGDKISIYKVH